MDTEQLEARLRHAAAQLHRAVIGVDTANSLVKEREAEHAPLPLRWRKRS